MDRNSADYRDAMRIGAYLMECILKTNHAQRSAKEAAEFMKQYTRLMARALQTNAAQMSVDIRDEWNKTFGGMKEIR